MWLLKARWKAASDWYRTASATSPVERDDLNSSAASVIRISVRRSEADRPSFSQNCERGARHVAKARKVRQRPCARRLVEESGDGRRQARMTGKRKETTRCIFGLACEPQHQRKHCGRQRVQHRATTEMIVRRLAAHQGDDPTRKLCGAVFLAPTAGMDDQARRQIGALQAIVQRCDRENARRAGPVALPCRRSR